MFTATSFIGNGGSGDRIGRARRSVERQLGFTLLEALVVLVLLGIVAFMAGNALSGARERSQLRSVAQQAQAFLKGAPVEAGEQGQTVRVRWDGAGRVFQLGTVTGGNFVVQSTQRVPDELIVRNGAGDDWPVLGGAPTLHCDPFGRALDPNSGTQLQGPVTFEMTAQAMVDGRVGPLTVYTVQLFPVWKVRLTKELR